MSVLQDVPRKATETRLTSVLTDATRRRIVRLLHEEGGPLPVGDLARVLVATADEEDERGLSDDAKRLRVRLRHVHLPKLAAAGIVSWDEGEGVVSIRDGQEAAALDGTIAADAVVDSNTEVLADPRRLAIVAHLESSTGTTDRATLAHLLASREADGEPSPARERDVETRLHHDHLPRLDEAGFVEYDHEAASVEYVGPTDPLTDVATIE